MEKMTHRGWSQLLWSSLMAGLLNATFGNAVARWRLSDLDSMDGLIFSSDVWAWRSVSFSNPPLLRLNTKSRDRHGPFSLTCHQNQFFLSRISYLEEVFLGCIILTHRSRLVVETAWGRNDYFCLCTSWRTDWSTLAVCRKLNMKILALSNDNIYTFFRV